VVIAAVTFSAIGEADPSEAAPSQGGDTTVDTRVLSGGPCPHEDDLVLSPYEQVLNAGVPGASEFLKITFETSVQRATRDKAVTKFLHKLARDGTNPIWESLSTAKFETTFASSDQSYTVDEVTYPNKNSAVILFTVVIDTFASQVPRVRGSAQVAGRLVCEAGFWRVTLADVCSILATETETGPSCPSRLKKKAKALLPRALKRAKRPEVASPTIGTVPTTTSPPTTLAPTPPPNFDGVCPYVGQPCSANVTNDPDCTCVPTQSSRFAGVFGVTDGVCRLRSDGAHA
jgi:hypothetical protein